jgi:putative solute:sodium symporter small subunit
MVGRDIRMPLVDSSQEIRGATSAAVDRATGEAYWKKTSGLMWLMLFIWVFFSFIIHIFAPSLNPIHILGFPLGFYMAAQGSLIAFVVALFWFAKRQNEIDEEFGVQED